MIQGFQRIERPFCNFKTPITVLSKGCNLRKKIKKTTVQSSNNYTNLNNNDVIE